MDLGPCVSDITGLVFEGCTSLESINVNADNENYCCVDGAVYTKDMTSIIVCPEGKTAEECPPVLYASLSKEKLDAFRTKFPAWADADPFELKD